MQTLQLLIALALVAYSVFSLVVYLGRRAENRGALRQLKDHGRPVREVTQEETDALQPFLVNPQRKGKRIKLRNAKVYSLHGEFLRHGLTTAQGTSAMHDTLGGVDVVMPYDATEYLQDENTAEVVITNRSAIVIALNGKFTLLAGRERARLREVQNQQWSAGENVKSPLAEGTPRGTNNRAGNEPQSVSGLTADGCPITVRVREQRDETANEAAARVGPGIRWLSLAVLALAFVSFLIAGDSPSTGLWFASGLLLLAVSLWLFWRQRKPAPPIKVNRVEGYVNRIALTPPGNSTAAYYQLFLGDKFPLVIPRHWLAWADFRADVRCDLDVRVDDYSVVRIGKRLSLDKEEACFPSIYWGRHLLFAGAGAAMSLCAALFFFGQWHVDAAHVKATFTGDGPLQASSPEELIARDEKEHGLHGMIDFKGNVRCQIEPPHGIKPPPITCNTVRWGGSAPEIVTFLADNELIAFYSGEMLAAQSNETLNSLMRMQQLYDGEGGYSFGTPAEQVYGINKLTPLVNMIERLCANDGADFVKPCRQIRQLLGERIVLVGEEQGLGWAELITRVKAGNLPLGRFEAIARDDAVDRIRSAMTDLGEAELYRLHITPLQHALDSQRGGVVLELTFSATSPMSQKFGDLPSVDAEIAPESRVAAFAGQPTSLDWPEQWAAYQQLSQVESLRQLTLRGLIESSTHKDNGDLVLVIDDTRNQENAPQAAARLFVLLLGPLFLIGHGALFAINFYRAVKRRAALKRHYAAQFSR